MSDGIIALEVTTVLAFVAALGFRAAVVDHHAEERRQKRLDQDVLASPGPEVLKVAAMEHAPMWADLLWLQIVQELGKPAEGAEASFDRVERWANIAVDLDQKYYVVYYASAVQLIVFGQRADAADKLCLKGRKFLPNRWELPFLLGYTAYFIHGDATKAAEWWELAVKLPDSPRFMPSLAERARYQSGDERGAIEMLESMQDYLEGPQLEDVKIRLKILKSEPRLRVYDEACKRFEAERGRKPKDGAELFAEHYAGEPPFDLLEKPITLDKDCFARTEVIFTREFEARKRIGSQKSPSEGDPLQ